MGRFPLRNISVSKPAYGTRTRHPYNGLNGGRERHGSVAAGSGIGSGAGFAGKSGHSGLPACCYGDSMEGVWCYYGILRGSPLPMNSGNIQHPTSNAQYSMIARMAAIGCPMLDAGCWMFCSGVQSANTGIRGILSQCPVLRRIPLYGGPKPPVGATFCILHASFCLPSAGQPAICPD